MHIKPHWPFGHFFSLIILFIKILISQLIEEKSGHLAKNIKKRQKMPKNTPKTPFLAHFSVFFVATFVLKSGQKVGIWPNIFGFLH